MSHLASRRIPENYRRRYLYSTFQFACIVILWHSSCEVAAQYSNTFTCDLKPYTADKSKFTEPRPGDNGFNVKLEGYPEYYNPEKTYTVTLCSTHPVTFRGFALTAVNSNDLSTPAGHFKILNRWSTKLMPLCNHIVTHATSGKKASVQFVWTSPPSGFGCVKIRASVIQKGSIWFQDEGDLSFTICEVEEKAKPLSETPPCCSCGSAKYRMTFYGLWSPQTHPKDYPGYSTHWSNVIGASHNEHYTVWDYGEYASDGVKKVAEWGWPNAAEDEIRAQGDSVLSVIKTRAQWPAFQPRNIREPPSSIFDVDSGRHLVSLLSMLGPSPDWNVGITKESMCTTQCGWESKKTYDLTPWDAGTDSGVSYLSPNSPTNPPEKIRRLTSSDDPESPFYHPNGGPITPVARVVLERLSITGDQCGPSPVSDSASNADRGTSVFVPPVTSCVYDDWSRWSQCQVSCGWGIKVRSKALKAKLVPSASCESTVMEKEICKGTYCENEDASTACLYSDWTNWSECTSSCGKDALRFRTRELKWPSEPINCHEPLKDMKFDCNTDPCEANQVECVYAAWSDWMPCSAQCGVGQTLRKRFAIDGDTCESPVMETSKCMASIDCNLPVGFDVPSGCTYSPWTGWMPCPASCGVGETFRKRVLASSTPIVHCEDVQMERTKCMTSESCTSTDELDVIKTQPCVYSDWSEWMPCSATCDVGKTLRKRALISKSPGQTCEEIEMENVDCYMPPCRLMTPTRNAGPGLLSVKHKSCMYGPWSAWMPCSVTCGKGETLRKRFLTKSLDISRTCEGFEMETNKCTVPVTCVEEVQDAESRHDLNEGEDQEENRIEQSWSAWTSCSATCGYGERSRNKMEENCDSSHQNECILTQLEECVLKERCPVNCELSEWSSWSTCPSCESRKKLRTERATKVRKSFQIRTRERLVKPKHGGLRCGVRREKRKCICP